MRVTMWSLVLLCLGTASGARDAAGLLSTIITPNEGVPVIARAGAQFEAVLTAQGELRLDGEEADVPLTATWESLPGGRHKARCTIPETAAPGAYALAYTGGQGEDRVERAVWIIESYPETYTIAHLSDTHVGSNRHPRSSTDIFRDMIQHVNGTDAAFVVITGDVTDGGEPSQFQDFLAILNTCAKPTFVCAGNHDRQALHYEQALGPLTYWFTFGEGDHQDGYLVFDTKDFCVASELDGQDALLQRYRRAIAGCRWRIGLSHRYEFDQGMRSQLTLYVDNPLDYLLYGHWHRENRTNAEAMPWPGVRATVTPAAINGAMRMFRIGPAIADSGIEPGPVMQVAAIGEKGAP